jgi:hypothetical protein
MTRDPSRIGGARQSRASDSSIASSGGFDVTEEVDASATRWLARKVRHVCDGAVPRSGRYRDTVRSETIIPSFSNSPWIRGAPQRWFSVAIRRMRTRRSASMHGLPGRRRDRRLQHPRSRSRCQRATVAGCTSTSAFFHPGHHRRKHTQNSRSDGRKRLSERPRTAS